MTVKCSSCDTEMIVRTGGKYGKFYTCPNSTPADSHPTRSIKVRRSSIFYIDYCEDWSDYGF